MAARGQGITERAEAAVRAQSQGGGHASRPWAVAARGQGITERVEAAVRVLGNSERAEEGARVQETQDREAAAARALG